MFDSPLLFFFFFLAHNSVPVLVLIMFRLISALS